MNLSDTARSILSAAAAHPLGLAAPPAALPAAARDAVRRSLLKQGLVGTWIGWPTLMEACRPSPSSSGDIHMGKARQR